MNKEDEEFISKIKNKKIVKYIEKNLKYKKWSIVGKGHTRVWNFHGSRIWGGWTASIDESHKKPFKVSLKLFKKSLDKFDKDYYDE